MYISHFLISGEFQRQTPEGRSSETLGVVEYAEVDLDFRGAQFATKAIPVSEFEKVYNMMSQSESENFYTQFTVSQINFFKQIQ